MKKLIALGVVMLMLLLAGCTAPDDNGENGEEPILGNVYYVANNGDNFKNNGSIDSPWETIQYAWTHTEPGDLVYVREGLYKEKIRSYKQSKSGNETHWITYKAYPGEKVTIEEPTHQYWRGTWQLTQQSYIHISGFWFVNGSSFGIMLAEDGGQIHNVTISDCHFYYYSESAIKVHGGLTGIEDIIIEGNFLDEICNSWYTLAGQEGISLANVNGFIVNNNTITRCYKQCIDAKSGSKNGEIGWNNINTTFGPNVNDTRKYLGGGIYIDSYSKTADNIVVHHNFIFGKKPGITLGAETGGQTTRVTIHNNIIKVEHIGLAINGKGWELPTTLLKDIYVIENIFQGNIKWYVNQMPEWKCINFVFERNVIDK